MSRITDAVQSITEDLYSLQGDSNHTDEGEVLAAIGAIDLFKAEEMRAVQQAMES